MNLSSSALALFLLISAISCTKNSMKITVDSIKGKWEINESNEIQTIEFNQNNSYIIEGLDQNENAFSEYGIFEIIDEANINLKGFGMLSNVFGKRGQLDFVLERSTGSLDTLSSTEMPPKILNSTVVETLCRTWKVLIMDDIMLDSIGIDAHVLFSESGTYFFADMTNKYNLSKYWAWKDDTEEIFCFSENDNPTCVSEESEAHIVELTDERLVLRDKWKSFELRPWNE